MRLAGFAMGGPAGAFWLFEEVMGQLRCCSRGYFSVDTVQSQRSCVVVVLYSSPSRVSDTSPATRAGGGCSFPFRFPAGLCETAVLLVPSHPLLPSASSAPPTLPLLPLASP